MLVDIGSRIINTDHIVLMEPSADPRGKRQWSITLTTGNVVKVPESDVVSNRVFCEIVPAPPGLVMVEAIQPAPSATDRNVTFVSATVIAFRLLGEHTPIPVGLDGEAASGNQTVVIQPDGRCIGWYDTWDSLDAFKEAQQAVADAEQLELSPDQVVDDGQASVQRPGSEVRPARSGALPLDELRPIIMAAPIEALRPGAPWRPGRDFAEVIAEVREANPQLHVGGVGYQPSFGWKWKPGQMESERAAMTSPGRVAEFECALRFLSYAARGHRTRSVNKRRSSYSWKHVAERMLGPGLSKGYVQNGMLIAAAYALGFTVQMVPNSPNAFINLSEAAAALDPQNGL